MKANEVGHLRIDVTSTLGSHLASFLVIGDKLEYLVVAEKTKYTTKASAVVYNQALKMPVDLKTLQAILFEKFDDNKSWLCKRDQKNFLKECKDKETRTDIIWVFRKGEQRTIDIENNRVGLQINLFDYSENITNSDKAFELNVPANIRQRRI